MQDEGRTRVVIVSFGGQVFRRPQSRSGSGAGTPAGIHPHGPHGLAMPVQSPTRSGNPLESLRARSFDASGRIGLDHRQDDLTAPVPPHALVDALHAVKAATTGTPVRSRHRSRVSEGALPSHAQHAQKQTKNGHRRAVSALHIAGAPLAAVPTSPVVPACARSVQGPKVQTALVDEGEEREGEQEQDEEGDDEPRLLPDDSWIAIVCGVSPEWGRENGEELPVNFFVAPRDVYMPDLTAVADVLLGKLVSSSVVVLFRARVRSMCGLLLVGIWHCLGVRRLMHALRLR